VSDAEYTPSDNDVREDFAYLWKGFDPDRPARLAAYDRWLKAHDAEVRLEVLQEEPG